MKIHKLIFMVQMTVIVIMMNETILSGKTTYTVPISDIKLCFTNDTFISKDLRRLHVKISIV